MLSPSSARLFLRRRELYARAAPVFARYGYRGTTLKALAKACGVSMPGFYRYFPSKRAFALFPLVALYPELHPPPVGTPPDRPVAALEAWVDAATTELPNYTLALRLAMEDGLRVHEQRRIETNLEQHVAILAEMARRAAPTLSERAALDLAAAMVNLVSSPALTNLAVRETTLRRELRALLRGHGITLGARSRPPG